MKAAAGRVPLRDLQCDECGLKVDSGEAGDTPGMWCPVECGGVLRDRRGEHERDRVRHPSINWPQSADEARRAVLRQVTRLINGEAARGYNVLASPFTQDAGLGQTRTTEQAEWLEAARKALVACLNVALERYVKP